MTSRSSEAVAPRCSVCGATRIVRDGRPGACSLVPGKDGKGGCPDPLRDVRAEERRVEERLVVTDLCDMHAFHKEGRLGEVLRRAINFIEGRQCFPGYPGTKLAWRRQEEEDHRPADPVPVGCDNPEAQVTTERGLCPLCGQVEPTADRVHLWWGGSPDHMTCVAREHAKGWVQMGAPWPPRAVVTRLADAVDHLLHDHDCDAHGHEEVKRCLDEARAWLGDAFIPANMRPNAICPSPRGERAKPDHSDHGLCQCCEAAGDLNEACVKYEHALDAIAAWCFHDFKPGDPEYGHERQCSFKTPDGMRDCGRTPEDHRMRDVRAVGTFARKVRSSDCASNPSQPDAQVKDEAPGLNKTSGNTSSPLSPVSAGAEAVPHHDGSTENPRGLGQGSGATPKPEPEISPAGGSSPSSGGSSEERARAFWKRHGWEASSPQGNIYPHLAALLDEVRAEEREACIEEIRTLIVAVDDLDYSDVHGESNARDAVIEALEQGIDAMSARSAKAVRK